MANLQGDSNIDDQTSLVDFMTWVKHLTGNKSIVEDKISQKVRLPLLVEGHHVRKQRFRPRETDQPTSRSPKNQARTSSKIEIRMQSPSKTMLLRRPTLKSKSRTRSAQYLKSRPPKPRTMLSCRQQMFQLLAEDKNRWKEVHKPPSSVSLTRLAKSPKYQNL